MNFGAGKRGASLLLFVLVELVLFGFAWSKGAGLSDAIQTLKFFLPTSEKHTPVEKLEVVGAGYGRTGTMSLKTALNMLDLKAYHMDQVNSYPSHRQLIVDAYVKEDKASFKKMMDAILAEGYKSTTDFPTCVFYKEQMEMFPDSKVILTLRDAKSWLKSYTSLMRFACMTESRPMRWFTPMWHFLEDSIHNPKSNYSNAGCIPKLIWYEPWYMPWVSYPMDVEIDGEKCMKQFNDFNNEVKRTVPKDRLLVFKVSDGWGPLCNFLNIPIPKEPFPSVNSGSSREDLRDMFITLAYIWPLLFALAAAVAIGIFYTGYKLLSLVLGSSKAPKTTKVE